MIKIENEKRVPAILAKAARDYCESIGAIEIYNIATLCDRDYRIMYYIMEGEKRVMRAVILQTPEEYNR